MAEEERDVPQLDELMTDIDNQVARYDQVPEEQLTGKYLMSEIKNTILPLLKDIVASTGLGFEEIQDLIEPVKITAAQAQNIGELLEALKAGTPGNSTLHARVDEALIDLEQKDAEGEEDPS